MTSALLDILNKGKKSAEINDDVDSGEILPQYELKNEEFEVENVASLSKKVDLSKFSHSEFNIDNNDNLIEINIFGHKEVINLAEESDTIANKLSNKFDVPFLALMSIVEMKRKEISNKDKARTIAYPDDSVPRNKNALLTKNRDYFKSENFVNLNSKFDNYEEFSGIDIFVEKKQFSEKGGHSNKNNLETIHMKLPAPLKSDNSINHNKSKEYKLKEVPANSNLFTIDHLFEGNINNNKKGLFTKTSGSSKKIELKNNNNLLSDNKKKNSSSNNNIINSKFNFMIENVSQSISHTSATTFSLTGSSFLGERLYRKSIALASQKKRKNEQYKKQEEANSKQECNFIPKTNPLNNLFGVEIKSKFQEKKIEKTIFPEEKIDVSPKK